MTTFTTLSYAVDTVWAPSLFLASSMMVSLIPLLLGRDTHGFVPLPIVNTLPKRVANSCPVAS